MEERTPDHTETDTHSDTPHKRRVRYRGTHPRTFSEKYKELNPDVWRPDVEKVIGRGDTPAGSHRSICIPEILEILAPKPGEIAVDCTLGYGGHAREILKCLLPGGKLYGLDADPIEIRKTEARFRKEGFTTESFAAHHINFAGLLKLTLSEGIAGFDIVLADLGVSSMQIDNPDRGFTFKRDGPLDMRMNPERGASAATLLERITEKKLVLILQQNADESEADVIARVMCQRRGKILTTRDLSKAIQDARAMQHASEENVTKSIRRTFQAIRIEVNDEFSALDSFLAQLPECMNKGGRIAILTFHSGEDRRVAGSFSEGLEQGFYSAIAKTAICPTAQEKYSNPRASSARLRWAIKA